MIGENSDKIIVCNVENRIFFSLENCLQCKTKYNCRNCIVIFVSINYTHIEKNSQIRQLSDINNISGNISLIL